MKTTTYFAECYTDQLERHAVGQPLPEGELNPLLIPSPD